VRDTGPGIAPADLARIFDAGFSTRAGSSGLGLSVCRRIAEQHGGAISAESSPGRGATFRLRLPRNPGAGAEPAPAKVLSGDALPAGSQSGRRPPEVPAKTAGENAAAPAAAKAGGQA